MAHDQQRLDELLGRAVGDFGGALQVAMGIVGDRLGLYRALRDGGAQEPSTLAQRTRTNERYVREWLDNQAAGGYVTYDPATKRYALSPEQAMALADEDSPAFLPGGWQVLPRRHPGPAAAAGELQVRRRHGLGRAPRRPLRRHRALLPAGLRREPGHRPGCRRSRASSRSSRPAATSPTSAAATARRTILMAKAYPRSRFTGFDSHPRSRSRPRASGRAPQAWPSACASRSRAAEQIPGHYDLITLLRLPARHVRPRRRAHVARARRCARTAPGCWSSRPRPAGRQAHDPHPGEATGRPGAAGRPPEAKDATASGTASSQGDTLRVDRRPVRRHRPGPAVLERPAGDADGRSSPRHPHRDTAGSTSRPSRAPRP